jgi:hypothetical protein
MRLHDHRGRGSPKFLNFRLSVLAAVCHASQEVQ